MGGGGLWRKHEVECGLSDAGNGLYPCQGHLNSDFGCPWPIHRLQTWISFAIGLPTMSLSSHSQRRSSPRLCIRSRWPAWSRLHQTCTPTKAPPRRLQPS